MLAKIKVKTVNVGQDENKTVKVGQDKSKHCRG